MVMTANEIEARELGLSPKTYKELYEVIEKHVKEEGEIYPNIKRYWLTTSGKRFVIKNVYGVMVSLEFGANSAIAECERRFNNEEY